MYNIIMGLFNYKCDDCGNSQDFIEKEPEANKACTCGGTAYRVFGAPKVRFAQHFFDNIRSEQIDDSKPYKRQWYDEQESAED